MNENKLISTIASSREAFLKLTPLVDKNTFSDIGQYIYKELIEYYSADKEAAQADMDIIKEKLKLQHEKGYDLIHEYIESLPEPVSVPNLLKLYEEHKKEKIGLDIIQHLASKRNDKASKLMEEFLATRVEEEGEELYNATPLD